MPEVRYCRNCGASFQTTRHDKYFCSAKCVAAHYRNNPNPEYIHEEKEHVHTHTCEHCGNDFEVNDYAQRQGQRTPKYCSPKCKQAAYRARGKFNQEQAQRRYGKAQSGHGANSGAKSGKGSTGAKSRQNANSGHSSANTGHSSKSGNFWDGYKNRMDAARAILGVDTHYSPAQIKKAWLALVRKYHPDVNQSPDATYQTQKINWAYEYLTK